MMGGDQGPQGKVGESITSNPLPKSDLLTFYSYPPSFVPFSEHRNMETRGTKCHGFDHILFAGEGCMTYYINNDQAGYKIEYPFAFIKNICLENGDVDSGKPGGLIVELNRPPNFFMDSSGSGGFFQCGDFTEDQQASQLMVHHLGRSS